MSRVERQYTVCDQCGGVIPDSADRFFAVGSQMSYQGALRTPFANLDFCCTQHLADFFAAQPTIPVPDPPFPPPVAVDLPAPVPPETPAVKKPPVAKKPPAKKPADG